MDHPAFGLLGVALIFLLALAVSEDRKCIRPRVVLSCFALQVAIAVFVLYTTVGQEFLKFLAVKVTTLLDYSTSGIEMIFGSLATEVDGFSFIVRVLPVIVFFAALMEVLYHLRIMQKIVKYGGRAMRFITGTRPVESLNVVANMFVGQTEAPLSLKPYLVGISRYELFTIMVSGLASIAGTVMAGYIQMGIPANYLIAATFMSAPAGLMMAKIIMPDPVSDEPIAAAEIYQLGDERQHPNVIMAASEGAMIGVSIAVSVGAMLLAFVSLIAVANGLLGWTGGWFGFGDLSVQAILGTVFAPVMWATGVPWEEARQAGAIFGEKVVTNEFVAYLSLNEQFAQFSQRTQVILTFALCGFANLASIGILLGGLGTIIPDRKPEIAKMGVKAVYAASLANLMSAALAGILVG